MWILRDRGDITSQEADDCHNWHAVDTVDVNKADCADIFLDPGFLEGQEVESLSDDGGDS